MKKDSHESSKCQEENILTLQRKVRMKAQDLATLAARNSFHMLRENYFQFSISYPAKLPITYKGR